MPRDWIQIICTNAAARRPVQPLVCLTSIVPENVVYSLDIGTYKLGARAQVLNSTTTAWCRLAHAPSSLESVRFSGTHSSGRFTFADGSLATTGRSMETLADAIATDIRAGASVALGMEAPMWFPTFRRHFESMALFARRFHRERGREWYLQSGAAATLKACSLGVLLFNQLHERVAITRMSTCPSDWTHSGNTLTLFEGFVTAGFKIPLAQDVPSTAANEWDALVAAGAWWLTRRPTCTAPLAQILHRSGTQHTDVLSVWRTIAAAVTDIGVPDGPPDCEVVGLELPRQNAEAG